LGEPLALSRSALALARRIELGSALLRFPIDFLEDRTDRWSESMMINVLLSYERGRDSGFLRVISFTTVSGNFR
jgi:hypothetical protein